MNLRSVSSIICSFFAVASAMGQTDYWQQTSGPTGGQISCFATTSNGDLYAGTSSGLYKSTDNGEDWTASGLTGDIVLSLTVNSRDQIFAGTYQNGIMRSTDSGASWLSLRFTDTIVYVVHATKAGHIFAGVRADGVYRSTDDGTIWSQVSPGPMSTDVW